MTCTNFLDEWHLLQLVPDSLALALWTKKKIEVLCVESEWRMDEVVQLEPDDKGGCEHRNGDDILQDDKKLAQYHFGMEAEVAFHNVDGLESGDLPRGHDA